MNICAKSVILVFIFATLGFQEINCNPKKTFYQPKGYLVPAITPMYKNGEMNLGPIGALAKYIRNNHLYNVAVGALAGESFLLNACETKALCKKWVDVGTPLGLKIIVSVAGLPPLDTIDVLKYCYGVGVKVAIVNSELLFRSNTAEEVVDYIGTLSKAVPYMSFIYYDLSRVLGIKANPLKTYQLLVKKVDNIVGIKCTADVALQIRAGTGNEIGGNNIYLDNDVACYAPNALNFTGSVPAVINLYPKECVQIQRYVEQGDFEKAQQAQNVIYDKLQVDTTTFNYILEFKKLFYKMYPKINVGPARVDALNQYIKEDNKNNKEDKSD